MSAYSTLLIRLRKRSGIPGVQAPRRVQGRRCRDLAISCRLPRYGANKQRPSHPRARGRVVQGEKTAERDAASQIERQPAARAAPRSRATGFDHTAIADMLELDLNVLKVDCEAALARHGVESGSYKIVRAWNAPGSHTMRMEPRLPMSLAEYTIHRQARARSEPGRVIILRI